jgi:hypothetical protein
MISPCRIRRSCNCVDLLPLAFLFATSFLALQPIEATAQAATGATFEQAGISWLPAIPIQITADVDLGYDDNVTLSSNGEASSFARENVVLTYARPGQRTQFFLLGVGRFSQFFDVTGQDDPSGNVTLSLTHNFSRRLSFYASIYAAYQNDPNFKSDIGPENVRAAHIETQNVFAVTYYWLPRLSTVTFYAFRGIKYNESSIGMFEDRVEQNFGERLHFSLTTRTNLFGEYRLQLINYDTAPLNSVTHYALVGVEHHLTEHLIFHVSGGELFRSLENNGNSISPYFESTVDYVSSNHSLGWTTSYSVEAPNAAGVFMRSTWRTGMHLTWDLTSRITSRAGVNYHHDENEGSISGAQDSLDVTLGLRYTINKHCDLHVNYIHNNVSSLGSTPAYSRNSYSAGVTYTY